MLNRFVNLQSRRFVFFPNQRNLSGELFKTNRDQSDDDSLDREALVSFHLGVKILKNAPVLAIVYENFFGCVLLIVELSGSIPKSLGNLDFNRIDLSRNKLEGDASMMFGAKKTAWSIDLSRNKFQFDISKVIVATTVNNLVLNHNGLTGSIPVQWTQLSLQTFNVSYNRLCGRIPQGGDLQRFDAYAYLHNKCLCGAPLRSCNKII
ncbi:hypothetical protein Rs2_14771 [Raphanus sativus]|nr:hypothetical protein Rs2_14771 [Raphanus sativus]